MRLLTRKSSVWMVEVSNIDLSNAVAFLNEYASTEHHGTTREINKRRRAKVLANKLSKRLKKVKK